ncbi:MAG: DoxX family protein [Proteobacteria bacterium]|nr:DoxX family protein [Pseudomonadota bacterium]
MITKEGISISQLFYTTLKLVIGLVFLYSGITKIGNPQLFSVIIDAYGILPGQLTLFAAFTLAGLEIMAGAGLIFDIRGSLFLIACLLILFIIILAYGIHMGLDVDCGCFGPDDPEQVAFHDLRYALYRDMVMISGIIYLYIYRCVRQIKPKKININPLHFNTQRRILNDTHD